VHSEIGGPSKEYGIPGRKTRDTNQNEGIFDTEEADGVRCWGQSTEESFRRGADIQPLGNIKER